MRTRSQGPRAGILHLTLQQDGRHSLHQTRHLSYHDRHSKEKRERYSWLAMVRMAVFEEHVRRHLEHRAWCRGKKGDEQ